MSTVKAIGEAITGIVGLGGALGIGRRSREAQEDYRQIEQQKKLQELAITGSKELTDYQKQKELEMWEATNYAAQVKQAEKAGLSVAWLMGKGGGGSGAITGGGGMSVGPAQAATAAATEQAETESRMMNAQIANINADTELKQASAGAQSAGTENTQQQTENLKIEQQFNEIRNRVAKATEYDAIDQIRYEATKMMHESNIAGTNQVINENTAKDQENKIKQEATGAMIANQAMRQGIKLDQARINQITNDIQVAIKNAETNRQGLDVSEENMKQLTQAMLWSAGINATGNLVNGILDVRKMSIPKKTISEQIHKTTIPKDAQKYMQKDYKIRK